MDDSLAHQVAQAAAMAIAVVAGPMKQEIEDLKTRMAAIEGQTVYVNQEFMDTLSARNLESSKNLAAANLSAATGTSPETARATIEQVVTTYPPTMMDAPAEPEPAPVKAEFTKGMMKGSQVYVARAVLPNNEGIIVYKAADRAGELPSLTVQRPDGKAIRYAPVVVKPEGGKDAS